MNNVAPSNASARLTNCNALKGSYVNDKALGTSEFEVRHRVLGYGSYRFAYGDGDRFATTLGIVYEGNSGAPYDWIYGDDANGDGENFNDLAYIPASEDEVFLTSENWEALDAYIEGEAALAEMRGAVPERNVATSPWVNVLDVRLSQELATFGGQRIQLNANLENAFAFLDEALGITNDLGTVETTSFGNIELFSFGRYISEEDVGTTVAGRTVTADDLGKPVVSFGEDTINNRLSGEDFTPSEFTSRWRLRLGVRYTF